MNSIRIILKQQPSTQMLRGLNVKLYREVNRTLSNQSKGNISKSTPTTRTVNPDVAGLSEKCLRVPNQPVGPNAAKDKAYKNPEYFCYNINSFAEAEVEMEKFRLKAPSNKVKFER